MSLSPPLCCWTSRWDLYGPSSIIYLQAEDMREQRAPDECGCNVRVLGVSARLLCTPRCCWGIVVYLTAVNGPTFRANSFIKLMVTFQDPGKKSYDIFGTALAVITYWLSCSPHHRQKKHIYSLDLIAHGLTNSQRRVHGMAVHWVRMSIQQGSGLPQDYFSCIAYM